MIGTISITLLLGFVFFAGAEAQTRYFEFRVECGHGNWQDTSFLAAASDPALIAEFLNEVEKPFEQRRFINGLISYGDGGYNRNAGHRFLWHFIPDQWAFAEMAVEVCDGCPYTDVDSDTAYWVGNIGYFCSWSARPVREVFLTSVGEGIAAGGVQLFHDRAGRMLYLRSGNPGASGMTIFDLLGREVMSSGGSPAMDISILPTGAYLVHITHDGRHLVRRLLLE